MPAGVHADPEQASEAQLRREAAKAQLDAENAAEEAHAGGDEDRASLSGTTARDDDESLPRPSEDTLHDEAHAAAVHTSEVES